MCLHSDLFTLILLDTIWTQNERKCIWYLCINSLHKRQTPHNTMICRLAQESMRDKESQLLVAPFGAFSLGSLPGTCDVTGDSAT